MSAFDTLCLLRDVPGVVGSYLVGEDGRVLVRDLPGALTDDVLVGLWRRADAALTTLSAPLPGARGIALRYAGLVVLCGRAGRNLLLVFGEPGMPTSFAAAALDVSAAQLAAVTRPEGPLVTEPPTESTPRRGDGIWG